MSSAGSPPGSMRAGEPGVLGEAERQIALTADRLRDLPLDRLERLDALGSTPADRAFALSRRIVGRSAESRDGPELPRLASRACGDQLAVVARDLLEASRASRDRAQSDELLRWLSDALLELRSSM